MKFVCSVTIFLFIIATNSYASLKSLLESGIIKEQNVKISSGLYIAQSIGIAINPFKFDAGTRLFYRIKLFENKEGYLWQNTKIDFGFENTFSLAYDRAGPYISVSPLSFFGVKVGFYGNFLYNIIKEGYAGFNNITDNYSSGTLKGMQRGDRRGFIFRATPFFKFITKSVVIFNSLSLSYISIGDKNYYYDSETLLLHKKDDFQIKNDLYVLGNINPFFAGAYYSLTYINGTKILSHKLGVTAAMSLRFLENKLTLDLGILGGLYFNTPNYDQSSFLEARADLIYKIF